MIFFSSKVLHYELLIVLYTIYNYSTLFAAFVNELVFYTVEFFSVLTMESQFWKGIIKLVTVCVHVNVSSYQSDTCTYSTYNKTRVLFSRISSILAAIISSSCSPSANLNL